MFTFYRFNKCTLTKPNTTINLRKLNMKKEKKHSLKYCLTSVCMFTMIDEFTNNRLCKLEETRNHLFEKLRSNGINSFWKSILDRRRKILHHRKYQTRISEKHKVSFSLFYLTFYIVENKNIHYSITVIMQSWEKRVSLENKNIHSFQS